MWLRPALVVIASLFPALAHAQSAAERANALNNEGKAIFAQGASASPDEARRLYEQALVMFNQAVRLSPEGRFYFNVCYTLNFLERYEEAIRACEQVEPSGADEKLIEKSRQALASLRQKRAAQGDGAAGDTGVGTGGTGGGGDPAGGGGDPAGGGGDPAGGGGNPAGGGGNPAGGDAVASDPFIQQAAPESPEDSFKWAIAGELGVLGNGSIGERDGVETFAKTGASVRITGSFMLLEQARMGVAAYLGIGALGPAKDSPFDDRLNLVDLGGALFKSFRVARHFYFTPLAGVHLSIQQPEIASEAFVAPGGRLEGQAAYVFGASGGHAITLALGLNIYGPASGSAGGFEPRDFNLDRASAAASFGVGYQHRFATPFGSTPLITLE
jgi:hypothetical protein